MVAVVTYVRFLYLIVVGIVLLMNCFRCISVSICFVFCRLLFVGLLLFVGFC